MIDKIKNYISEEYQKGNKEPYKKVLSFCMRLYRSNNKDKVAVWNATYRKRINLISNKKEIIKRINLQKDDNKKNNSSNNTEEKSINLPDKKELISNKDKGVSIFD